MKKNINYILWALFVIVIAIQFVPLNKQNPVINKSADFLLVSNAPDEVRTIIQESCYNCHSNETEWPWYSKIAPVSFMITHHVAEARENLNFSEWTSYDSKDLPHILQRIKKEIKKDEMPLSTYLLIHPEAKMNAENKTIVFNWIDELIESYKSIKGE